MKEIYVLATENARPKAVDVFRDVLEAGDARVVPGDKAGLFSLHTGEMRVDVRFEAKNGLKSRWAQLTGSDGSLKLLNRARGLYWIAFEPGKPQPSVGVFEALWCARSLMEQVPGVLVDLTALKVHDPGDVAEITELEFDIRDHVNLHAIDTGHGGDSPLWVHSHGMEKFGARDVEVFYLGQRDLMPGESFLYELCTDLAFGHAPAMRRAVETSVGAGFKLVPSEEARNSLMGLPLETFDGHEGSFLTVVAADGRHTLAELLRPYRERFERETPEEAEFLLKQVEQLMPAFKARFQRKGWMEPLTFLVRAPFETRPKGRKEHEDLWVEVLTWENDSIRGKLIDGGSLTTEWRKGTPVELEEDHVNAIALGRDGRTLEDEDMQQLLMAERPM